VRNSAVRATERPREAIARTTAPLRRGAQRPQRASRRTKQRFQAASYRSPPHGRHPKTETLLFPISLRLKRSEPGKRAKGHEFSTGSPPRKGTLKLLAKASSEPLPSWACFAKTFRGPPLPPLRRSEKPALRRAAAFCSSSWAQLLRAGEASASNSRSSKHRMQNQSHKDRS
jgi:hypothetical protein